MRLLVTYASPHGSTAEVATYIGRLLSTYGVDVDVEHADTVTSIDDYDACIIGSAVHSSMWLPSISRFMYRFESALAQKTIYLFLMCVIVLEEGGREKALTNYVWGEALDRLNISRENIEAFAGRMDWNRVSGDERWLLSVNYEGNKLPGEFRDDYRDWQAIAAWAHTVAGELGLETRMFDDSEVPVTKEETITTEEVAQMRWPENPAETNSI